jgi:glycosyltransferase involved in cell wall biosynthesis
VKGHDVLVQALARLVRDGRDLHLTMVGDGTERARLERRVSALGLSGRVRFAGALSGESLVTELAHADLYVQPSRREGFGVALVEAMATGLPVVATRSGGPEGIVTAADGVLAAPDDAPALAAAMGEALDRLDGFDAPGIASRVRERYSRAAVGNQLLGLYRELAAPGSAGPDDRMGR